MGVVLTATMRPHQSTTVAYINFLNFPRKKYEERKSLGVLVRRRRAIKP